MARLFLDDAKDSEEFTGEWWEASSFEAYNGVADGYSWAQLPENGSYEAKPYTEHFVEVELPAEQDAGYPEPAVMHVALWMPDVPEDMKIPVIMTIHPYYDFGGEGMPGIGDDSNPNTIPDGGVGNGSMTRFAPRICACPLQPLELKIYSLPRCKRTWRTNRHTSSCRLVREQNWSNGNVGLMGKSYAGTTNWEAAQQPSDHLKTIVPISGSIRSKYSTEMARQKQEPWVMMLHIKQQHQT